ncbi:MAG: hemerythrin domain-containing protein [Hydrogenophaga sp.]
MTHEALRVIREEHATLAAMLQSLMQLVRRGPEADGTDDSARFFDVLRAMLFYIDEFPEQQHHPKESDLLFPRVARVAPHAMATIDQLERDHQQGESRVRDLMHRLMAWELLGETRKAAFIDEVTRYVDFYLEHMRLEETVILPEAERLLSESDWQALNAAFSSHPNPLSSRIPRDPLFDRLFTRIVMKAPAPVGLGH